MSLQEAADASFIVCEHIPMEHANTCVDKSLKSIQRKLVWSVVSLSPTASWAIQLNKWRWSTIIKIVKKCNERAEIYTIADNQTTPFVLDKHVGRNKLFVNSDIISLNCSTTVESDVDITYFYDAEQFVQNVKDVMLTNEASHMSIDIQRITKATEFEMQRALTAMFDVEFFSSDHDFKGDNAVIDQNNQLVPVMSPTTWNLSQRRLISLVPTIRNLVPYPSKDLCKDHPLSNKYRKDGTTRYDKPNPFRLNSDGYYTRPAYMYVADPYSSAHSIISKTNIEVVQNSYKALMMVVFENLGFAMEYVDPEKHGRCPTVQSRAKKIAKYAGRVSQALNDIGVIFKNYGAETIIKFKWWDIAGKGRDADNGGDAIRQAFNIDPQESWSMNERPNLLRNNLEKQIIQLIEQLKETYSMITHIKRTRDASAKIIRSGIGGGIKNSSYGSLVGLILITFISSFWPR